jgi:excisionase family DNA binding protein
MEEQSREISVKKTSEVLGVNEETVRRWVRSGDLHAEIKGKTYIIDAKDLVDFAKKNPKFTHLVTSGALFKLLGLAGIFQGIAAGLKFGKKTPPLTADGRNLSKIEQDIRQLETQYKKSKLKFELEALEINEKIDKLKDEYEEIIHKSQE